MWHWKGTGSVSLVLSGLHCSQCLTFGFVEIIHGKCLECDLVLYLTNGGSIHSFKCLSFESNQRKAILLIIKWNRSCLVPSSPFLSIYNAYSLPYDFWELNKCLMRTLSYLWNFGEFWVKILKVVQKPILSQTLFFHTDLNKANETNHTVYVNLNLMVQIGEAREARKTYELRRKGARQRASPESLSVLWGLDFNSCCNLTSKILEEFIGRFQYSQDISFC